MPKRCAKVRCAGADTAQRADDDGRGAVFPGAVEVAIQIVQQRVLAGVGGDRRADTALLLRRPAFERPTPQRMAMFVLGVGCGAVGNVASLHVLQHVGLALALAGWLGMGWGVLLWLMTAVCWMPGVRLGSRSTLAAERRAAGPNAPGVHGRWLTDQVSPCRASRSATDEIRKLGCTGRGACREFRSPIGALTGAEERLAAMQIRGDGFDSRGVALAATESKSLGAAIAVRRLYRFGEHRVLATVIDGTHNRHAIHDPLYCFTGAGWRITKDERLPARGIVTAPCGES